MTPAQAINHLEEVAACEPEDFEAIAVLRALLKAFLAMAATTREPDRGSAKWCAQQPGYLPSPSLQDYDEFYRDLGGEA